MVIVSFGNIIGYIFYFFLGICHGYSKSGIADHGNIIKAVAAADHFLSVDTQDFQQMLQAVRLIHIFGNHLQKAGFRPENPQNG